MEYARSFLWACNRVLNSPATLAEFFGNNCWNGTFSPGTSRWCIGFPAAFWSVFSKTKAIQKNFPGCGLGSQKRPRQGTGTQWMSLREPGTRPALSRDWQQIRAVMWENGIATSMRFFEIYTASLTKFTELRTDGSWTLSCISQCLTRIRYRNILSRLIQIFAQDAYLDVLLSRYFTHSLSPRCLHLWEAPGPNFCPDHLRPSFCVYLSCSTCFTVSDG